ncbi:hypothetical protein R1sor_026744 [Riccia sorocarpa]|uniref:Nicastrin n=1 Tax=Riccia sorocarpa TaxID=122646 RepID=A0ABD3GFX9_9MARC
MNVWSALPALNASGPTENSIVLVMAALDSASFFRDATPGADSSLSGLIAMLAAADALSRVADVDQFQKQSVFLAVTGEAWGYLGNRRFLLELAGGNPSLSGVHQVLEVGSVGKAVDAACSFSLCGYGKCVEKENPGFLMAPYSCECNLGNSNALNKRKRVKVVAAFLVAAVVGATSWLLA